MKTSHAFAFSNEQFMFNFQKKLLLDDEYKKESNTYMVYQILQAFTNKMIY